MDPALICSCHSKSQSGTLVLNAIDSHISTLQGLFYFVKSAEYVQPNMYSGQVGEHYDELFIIEGKMEAVFVVSQEDFYLNPEFIQPREAFSTGQTMKLSVYQMSPMLRSHFFGQKFEESIIFHFCANEVEH